MGCFKNPQEARPYLLDGARLGALEQLKQDFALVNALCAENIKLREGLKKLTKVGPPSRSCTGAEWAEICLIDHCKLAESILSEVQGA